jgi:hypothetical protein
MIDESPLMVARGVARRDVLQVPAEVIEIYAELGAEVQQPASSVASCGRQACFS